MRVLWFATNPGCYNGIHTKGGGYNGGGWMSSMQQEIMKQDDIRLGVSFCMNGQPWKVEQGGTTYYPIPTHRKHFTDKIKDLLYSNDLTRDKILWPHYINHFKRVIEDFHPDVIEVFGSELYTGLATIAAKELRIPCCLHIQGLLSLYIYIYLTPGMSRWNYLLSNGLRHTYANFQYLTYWQRSCLREKAILRAAAHVIGRTDWDRQAMEMLAPQAKYHYGGEILRSEFYEQSERKQPLTTTITTTISNATYKGFDLLLKTANILKNELGLDFIWNVYGNIEPSFYEHLTDIHHKDVNVCLRGVASASELRDALLNSTMYCHTSYVENSPNSIAEAQILGIPVVATNVGGTASMVSDGETGLLFPATDPYMAAQRIITLATNRDLNISIGNKSKDIATGRHNRHNIIKQLLDTYSIVKA